MGMGWGLGGLAEHASSTDLLFSLLFLSLLTHPQLTRLGDMEVLSSVALDPTCSPGGPKGQAQGLEAVSHKLSLCDLGPSCKLWGMEVGGGRWCCLHMPAQGQALLR